jgi:hypothetical protein
VYNNKLYSEESDNEPDDIILHTGSLNDLISMDFEVPLPITSVEGKAHPLEELPLSSQSSSEDSVDFLSQSSKDTSSQDSQFEVCFPYWSIKYF